MDIRPSEEQELLRDTLRRFLADRVPAADAGSGPIARADWLALGELGVLAVLATEEQGGLAGRPQEAAILAEAFGRALAVTPFAESILAAADLVARHGSAATVERWLALALAGEALLALAAGEIAVEGDRLGGRCAFVRWGAAADAFVVAVEDRAWLVAADAAGVTREPVRLADGSMAAMLTLDGAAGEPLAARGDAVARALAMAQLGYVAEMVGAMATVRVQTAEHVGQRSQFGTPIGSFQVVQHKIARMFVRHEQAASLLLRAALTAREAPEFIRHVTAAKAYVADAAQAVAEEAVQLHGGMGVTDELPVARALRRVLVLARLFGRADEARAALAA